MKIVRIASLCLVFASVAAVPLTASAAQKPGAVAAKNETLDAATYRKAVEARLDKMKAKVEKRSAKLPEDKREAVKKDVAAAEKEVRAALDKAAADGVITKDEARSVHAAAKKLREIVKTELPKQHAQKHKTPASKNK